MKILIGNHWAKPRPISIIRCTCYMLLLFIYFSNIFFPLLLMNHFQRNAEKHIKIKYHKLLGSRKGGANDDTTYSQWERTLRCRYSWIHNYLYGLLTIVLLVRGKQKFISFIYDNEEFLTINSRSNTLKKKIILFLGSVG